MKKKKAGWIIAALILIFCTAFGAAYWMASIKKEADFENLTAEIPDMDAGEVELSEDNYITTPSTEEVSVDEDTQKMYVNNLILIYAKVGTAFDDIAVMSEKYGLEIVGYTGTVDFYQLRMNDARTIDELEELASELEKEELVEMAFVDVMYEVETNMMPDDPWIGIKVEHIDGKTKKTEIDAGGFMSETPDGSNWGTEAIYAMEAWEYVDFMDSVNVGIMDSVWQEHEDVEWWYTTDVSVSFSSKAKSLIKGTSASHGTHVAGIIAAIPNNKKGITGICAVEDTGLYFCSIAKCTTISEYIAGLTDLVEHDVKVVNFSWTNVGSAQKYAASHGNEKAIKDIKKDAEAAQTSIQRLLGKGYDFVICTSAGNDNDTVFYKQTLSPYGYVTIRTNGVSGKTKHVGDVQAVYNSIFNAIEADDVKSRIIVVGSIGLDETTGTYFYSDFSNIGDRVDVAAPGEYILSTVKDNGYETMNGTSQAAPHVTAVAAMLFGCDPSLTGPEVKKIIMETADYSQEFSGTNAGLLNAQKAVEMALNPAAPSGIWDYMEKTYGELKEFVNDVNFFDSMDYPGSWFANGYLGGASITAEFTGYNEGDEGAFPTSISVYDMQNGEGNTVFGEDLKAGMTYKELSEKLEISEYQTIAHNTMIADYFPTEKYGVTLMFAGDDENAILSAITVYYANGSYIDPLAGTN